MPIGTTPGEVSEEKIVLGQGPVGNVLVQTIDSAVRYAVYLTNFGGDILTDAETAPGTYTVHRVRAGTDTEITAATAATEASGVVSAVIDFSDGSWAEADLGYIEFSGITATINEVTSELAVLRKSFRVTAAVTSTEHQVPSADATTNTLMRDVAGNKTDTARTTVGTTRSLMSYLKGALNQLATLVGFHTVPSANATTNAQLRDVAGNKTDAAQTTVGTTRSLMGYMKGILNLSDTSELVSTFTYTNAGGTQTVFTDTSTTRRRIWLEFSNRNMTQTGVFLLQRRVDGTNFDQWTAVNVTAGGDRAFDAEFTTTEQWRLQYFEDVDEGADRVIPFNVITQEIE